MRKPNRDDYDYEHGGESYQHDLKIYDLVISLSNNNDKKNPLWDEAFSLYKEEFPNSDLGKECRSCRQKIMKWLRRG